MPQPLHPAIVHFPIVLVLLLPAAALAAFVLVRRGHPVRASWLPVVVLAFLLSVSSLAAVRTGGEDEERVEEVVSEAAIERHEERAEAFLPLTVVLLVIAAAGLVEGRAGTAIRATTVVAAMGLMLAGWAVGHSGGELVYRHGAATAWTSGSAGSGEWSRVAPGERGGDDDDDESEHGDR